MSVTMKVFALVCALLVTGSYAQSVKATDSAAHPLRRDIFEILADAANTLADFLRLIDPIKIPYYQLNLEILESTNVGVSVDNVVVSGFSDIDIPRVEYNDGMFSIDIALVDVLISADLIRVYLGSGTAEIKGSFDVKNLGFSLDLDLDCLTVNDFQLVLNEPTFVADVEANAFGQDYTDLVMEFLNVSLPSWLHENAERLASLIRYVIITIINKIRDHS